MLPTHYIHNNRSVKMDDPFQAHLAQTPTLHTYRHSQLGICRNNSFISTEMRICENIEPSTPRPP